MGVNPKGVGNNTQVQNPETKEEFKGTFKEILTIWEKEPTATFILPDWVGNKQLVLRGGKVMIKTNQHFEFYNDVFGYMSRKDWKREV